MNKTIKYYLKKDIGNDKVISQIKGKILFFKSALIFYLIIILIAVFTKIKITTIPIILFLVYFALIVKSLIQYKKALQYFIKLKDTWKELLNTSSINPLFIYPLNLLNIFELGYFLVLAWLLVGVINEANEQRQVKFGQSLKLVTASYGSGLLLWVLVVMFITLNLS